MELKNNEFLFKQGTLSTDLFFVSKGTLKVTSEKEGFIKELANIRPGELIGEMAFLDNRPRSASVKATSDCILQVIDKKQYKEFIKNVPAWLIAFQKSLLARLRDQNSVINI